MLIPQSFTSMESMQLTQETDSSTQEAEVSEDSNRVAIVRTSVETQLGPRLEACWMQLLGVPGDLFQMCFPMVGRESRRAHLHGAVVQLMPFFERDGHQIANRQKAVVAPLDCQKRSLFLVDRRILRPINHLRDSMDLSNKYRYKVVVQASATVIDEARLCQQAQWTSTCSLRLKNGSVKEYDPMCVRLGIPLACRAQPSMPLGTMLEVQEGRTLWRRLKEFQQVKPCMLNWKLEHRLRKTQKTLAAWRKLPLLCRTAAGS